MTTAPHAASAASEHDIITMATGYTMALDCYVDAVRVTSGASTIPSSQATKFILVNFTTGVVSQEITWPINTRIKHQSSLSGTGTGSKFTCAAGDVIGVLVTQEDGTHEHTDVGMDLWCVPQ